MKIKSAFLSIMILLFFGCQYFTLESYKDWKNNNSGSQNVDVYVGGFVLSGTNYMPCYWKNGSEVDFTGQQSSSLVSVLSIYVDGNDVYCGGYYLNGPFKPCYWKNGELHPVHSDATGGNARIYSIQALNGVVFSAGNDDNSGNIPSFWVNDNKVILNNSGTGSQAKSIFVDKDSFDIYVSGSNRATSDNAAYWKNGGAVNTIDTTSSTGNSIYVSNGNIYVGGYNNGGVGGYWKNSNFTLLPSASTINSIFVYNGDIYTCGPNNDSPIAGYSYWKNLTENPFPASFTLISAITAFNSLYVYSGDVYVAGIYTDSSGNQFAAYYKNGNVITLSSVAGSNTTSIFVKAR